jgi:hypothetical protein
MPRAIMRTVVVTRELLAAGGPVAQEYLGPFKTTAVSLSLDKTKGKGSSMQARTLTIVPRTGAGIVVRSHAIDDIMNINLEKAASAQG